MNELFSPTGLASQVLCHKMSLNEIINILVDPDGDKMFYEVCLMGWQMIKHFLDNGKSQLFIMQCFIVGPNNF